MSLIYFHICLMLTAIVFSIFFGVGEIMQYGHSGKPFDLIAGIIAFVFDVCLTGYLVWFIRKKKPLMSKK